ncbi:dentin sialophosphoprotein [Nilaparvata lugens]|uniref:dentin sialophosphoprotein n=1 Tax=Nilaparvata lugens TaxID=108931 RepID=UPI00193EA085|nr:dentin sialophosphoprotein [Nilaparvata lugens]
MGWLAVLTIAAVVGSISCVENYHYNNFGNGLQGGNFNAFKKFPNFGSIQQPSGHWHYTDDDEDDLEEENTLPVDENEETDSNPEVDGNNSNFVVGDEQDNTDPDDNDQDDFDQDDFDQDFGLDEIQIDARGRNGGLGALSSLPALKNQLKSISNSLVNRKLQNGQSNDNTPIDAFNDPTEETSLITGSSGDSSDFSQLGSQTESGDTSNLFGGLLAAAIPTLLSNGLNKASSSAGSSQNEGLKNPGDISNLFRELLGSAILSNKGSLGQDVGRSSSRNRGQSNKLTGEVSNLIAGLLGSSIGLPKEAVSNGLNKGISKIGNIRNNVLDFRDRALDRRVGIAQRNQLNQFDPRFQASLSKSDHVLGDDQLTWNKVANLVTKFQPSSAEAQQSKLGTSSLKNSILGLLGSTKGAVTTIKGAGESSDNSGTKRNEDNQSVISGFLGFLGNAVTSSSGNKGRGSDNNSNDDSNKGGRFQFLTNAKNFVTNPVDFVERRIRNKIKKKIKNEIKQCVGDLSNRVVQFKSNMTGLAGGVVESFIQKPSQNTNKNCLKILTGPQAHQLYLNGKHIPESRIIYVDKLYPLDFNSCPVNHQNEVLRNCLLKGNVLVLSQPDKVKVEEEHGRQLEMIIAKDVIKDRLNGLVDTFFQNFGRQFIKGVHIFRGDGNE